jgi:hypothetical protein
VSKVIWKYRLEGAKREFEMPVGAEIVHVGMQREYGQEGLNYEVPTFWAIVDPEADREVRTFHLAGTGILLPSGDMKYHGTVMDGAFVWHLLEMVGP